AKEVRKEGLKALLDSSAPLGYFLYHLLNEYSSENLFFYLAVENYQSYNFTSDMERQQVANKIAKAYLTTHSDLEVNLEDKISRTVRKALLEQQRQPSASTGLEFEAAKRHVFSLLNVSYHRFRSSSIWDIMESKC
ncbi:RGS domain-containing protein, partial [Mucor mucedo]|uniref:RGS domain-containing protein n=1 Tax=Mucor mucedo TaxID=29922 RepID=UPI00221F6A12